MISYTTMEEGYGQFIVLDNNNENNNIKKYFNEHNDQYQYENDIEKNITNPFYYNTSFCIDSPHVEKYKKNVNNSRFLNNQHFVIYFAIQGLNIVQNVYTSIFG